MVHFVIILPTVSPPDTQNSSSHPGELSSTIPNGPQHYPYETPFDTTIDIETQSIGNPMDIGSHHGQTSIYDHATPPFSNIHCVQSHIGYQTSIEPPSLEVKEQNKNSLPTFGPQKMSWQNFSMKLHAAIIDCNMEYLLTESSTNCLNCAYSKELKLELYKKLQGSAFDLFSSVDTGEENSSFWLTIWGGSGSCMCAG